MSTKLFHGWRIKGITLEKLLPRLLRFRKAAYAIAENMLVTEVADRCRHRIDSVAMSGRKHVWEHADDMSWVFDHGGFFAYIAGEVDREIHESFTKLQRSSLDIECSVTCHPVRGAILLLLFDNSPGRAYEKAFKSTVKAESFPYWDNTDPPKDMQDKNGYRRWEARGRLWDRALGDGIPAENGFSFTCIGQYGRPHPRMAPVLKRIGSFASRVDAAAYDAVGQARMRVLARREKELDDSASGFVGRFLDAQRWMKTTAGKRAVKKAKVRARRRLSKEITAEDLMKPVKKYFRKAKKHGE